MSRAMMSAPSSARRRACERPCPRAAPVMNATLPSSDPMAGEVYCTDFSSGRVSSMTGESSAVDLLVLGAGMAGCAAGLRAAQEGASVVLAEEAAAVGGAAAYAGFLWSAPTLEVMRRENPEAD